jgi:hypothetical protein
VRATGQAGCCDVTARSSALLSVGDHCRETRMRERARTDRGTSVPVKSAEVCVCCAGSAAGAVRNPPGR